MIQKAKRKYNREEALYRMAALCSKSEQCCYDITVKLQKLEMSVDDIDYIIEYLLKDKYIDDTRYANAYARDKARFEGWGRIKIAYNLKLKRINKTLIDDAISSIEEDGYIERLYSILKSKAKQLQGKDSYQARASLYRFALSRGFEPEITIKEITKILGNEDNECFK